MISNEFHLPFFINNVYEGFARAKGMLHTSSEEIHLEYQISDALGGILKSDTQNVFISIGDLLEISFKSNLFQSKLTLLVSNLQSAESLPKSARGKAGEIILRFDRKDREKVKRIVSRMNLLISEYRARRSEDGLS